MQLCDRVRLRRRMCKGRLFCAARIGSIRRQPREASGKAVPGFAADSCAVANLQTSGHAGKRRASDFSLSLAAQLTDVLL